MRVLVVEDDPQDRESLRSVLASWGHEVKTADDGVAALGVLERFAASVILTDLKMPRMDGFALLKELRSQGRMPPTIVLTAFGSLEVALSTIHDLGGFWFLEKPVDPSSLKVLLERAYAQSRLEAENRNLRQVLSYHGALGDLVGSSPQMMQVFSLIRQVAPANVPVLITGESGVGKELVARAIHGLSPRSAEPFIAINCAAIPETLLESELFGHEKGAFTGAHDKHQGCLEMAQNGTLFLDELGEMPAPIQAKLLRVLEDFRFRRIGGKQEIEVDVRVLAATNRSPAEALREGKLREDLYYRLSVFHIDVPPLRERPEDIPALTEALIHSINRKHDLKVTGISGDAMSEMLGRRWAGNIRELRNVLERAAILTGEGEIKSLMAGERDENPTAGAGIVSGLGIRIGMTIDEAERLLIEATLRQTHNNKTRAAVVLGISAKTLHAKLRQYRGEQAVEAPEQAQTRAAPDAGTA